MGFRDDRRAMLEAIRKGDYAHELRGVPGRNHLQIGTVDIEFVVGLIQATRGHQATSAVHHQRPEVTLWIMKPLHQGQQWYVKCYLHGAILWFISIHPREVRP